MIPIIYIIVSCLVLGFLFVSIKKKQKRAKTKTTDYYNFFNKTPKIDVDSSPLFNNDFILKQKTEPYLMILDTETTELVNAIGQPSLPIAISWLLVDKNLNLLNKKEYILKQNNISQDSTLIHKITKQISDRGDKPETVINDLLKDINKITVIVGHNLRFHISVIKLQMERLSLDCSIIDTKKTFCTMLWGTEKRLITRNEKNKYPSLSELFGILYFDRQNIEISYQSKSKRDIMLILACLRKIKKF